MPVSSWCVSYHKHCSSEILPILAKKSWSVSILSSLFHQTLHFRPSANLHQLFYGRQKAFCIYFLANFLYWTFFFCWLELNSSAFCWLQISCILNYSNKQLRLVCYTQFIRTYLLLRYGLSAQFLQSQFYKKLDTIAFQRELFFCG